ncbi:uncharacterized protein [Ptychodera flava]|uniref:uncharacterized protein n=1 Tax=Ptychodera flava TaxID=63121 RepID=UPI00396A82D1
MKWSAAIFLVQYVEMVSPSFYSNITSTLPLAFLPTTTPRQTLAQWFAANAHLPDVCRKDFCVENRTEDLKGVIQWPGTQAGDNVTVTCPHGAVPLKDDIAYRSCAYSYDTYTGEYTAQWETPMTDNCIWESSTTRQLFNLKANLSKAYSTGSYNLAPGILEDIRKLMGNVTLLTEADFEICADVFEMTTVNMKNFKAEVMQDVGVIIVETISQMSDVSQDVLIVAEESCDR